MTKEEWEKVRKAVEIYPNRAKLKIDGYTLDMILQNVNPYHNEIVVFINGECRLDLCLKETPESEEIRKRFLCPSTKCFVKKPKCKLSKKNQKLFEEEKKRFTITTYSPFWKSFSKLKAHLIKNNSYIEILEANTL